LTVTSGSTTLQQWLRERGTVSRYTYIACLVIITFVQGVFNYMPERNSISWVYSFAAALKLQLMIMLFFFFMKNVFQICISTFRSMCPVPIKADVLSRYVAAVFSE
jgi:hypothetical protein